MRKMKEAVAHVCATAVGGAAPAAVGRHPPRLPLPDALCPPPSKSPRPHTLLCKPAMRLNYPTLVLASVNCSSKYTGALLISRQGLLISQWDTVSAK
jgi:hypothetical protein